MDPFQCEPCLREFGAVRVFSQRGNLNKHIRKHHPGEEVFDTSLKIENPDEELQPLQCEFCAKEFGTKRVFSNTGNYRKHVRLHHSDVCDLPVKRSWKKSKSDSMVDTDAAASASGSREFENGVEEEGEGATEEPEARTSQSDDESEKDEGQIWCETCGKTRKKPCWKHANRVADAVEDFATASLPATLKIVTNNATEEKTIVAKQNFPVNTMFGPLIAPVAEDPEALGDLPVPYSLRRGRIWLHFDLQSDIECNWMKFVRFADKKADQNLAAYALNGEVMFLTTKPVTADEELRVWYSPEYSKSIGKPLVPKSEDPGPRRSSRIRKPKVDPDEANSRKRKATNPQQIPQKKRVTRSQPAKSESAEPDLAETEGETSNVAENGDEGEQMDATSAEPDADAFVTPKRLSTKPAFKCVTVLRSADGSEVVKPLRPPRPRVRPIQKAEKPPKTPAPRSLPYQYHCVECGLFWQLEELLDLHNLKHLPPEPVEDPPVRKCPKCPFSRKDPALMAHHVREHAWNQTQVDAHMIKMKCEHCPGSFSDLAKHMYTVHREEYLKLTEFDGLPLSHQCQYCEMKFTTRHALQGHTQMHTKAGDFSQCIICMQHFPARTAELREHLETHLENEHWSCRLCGRKYRLYNSLCEHMRVMHDPSRTSVCPICNKMCRTAEKLKRHVETHSSTLDYACQVCGKGFKSKSYVKYHLTYTHGMKKRNKRRQGADSAEPTMVFVQVEGEEPQLMALESGMEGGDSEAGGEESEVGVEEGESSEVGVENTEAESGETEPGEVQIHVEQEPQDGAVVEGDVAAAVLMQTEA